LKKKNTNKTKTLFIYFSKKQKKTKMPGASILPTALHDGKLYFLLGRENPMEERIQLVDFLILGVVWMPANRCMKRPCERAAKN